MNSIQQQQEEHNHENLRADAAVEKIKVLAGQSRICFFCTTAAAGATKGSRPMSVLQVDDDGTLWFVSPVDSNKNKEILEDAAVKLYFHGSAHSDLMYLNGQATIHPDKSKIKEIWNPLLKTWFTEGQDDPRISIIRVRPEEGYYWDSKHGNFIATIKMFAGAVSGKTIDDSIEGSLSI